MSSLDRIVAAHPVQGIKPYNRIKFSRIGPHGTALYKVGKGKREYGAERALRIAFQRFGGQCFYCEMPLEVGSPQFTLDHLRPERDGGEDHLHNLVFACRSCNKLKGANDLAAFAANKASAFLAALDDHLVRCLKQLS